jgi:hypothetical protein
MPRQPYPLEALRQLRDDRVERQAQRLAAQVARSVAAAAQLSQREQARRDHERATESALRAERERLTEGGMSGADLRRLTEFEDASRVQARLLLDGEVEARQALSNERAEEQKLREQLANLEAEARLVRNHEASFHERNAELREKADEEAALEQWSARRH